MISTKGMKGISIAPMYNKKGHDATDTFQKGAQRFRDWYGFPFFKVENVNEHPAGRGPLHKSLYKAMDSTPGPWNVFAYFGHGDSNPRGLCSIGVYLGREFDEFVKHLLPKAADRIIVLLYACLAGLPDGVAQHLQRALVGKRATVYGHTTEGHSFTNPFVRWYGVRFGRESGKDGTDLIPFDKNDYLWNNWVAALSDERGTFWARFPFMTDLEIRYALCLPTGLVGQWHLNTGAHVLFTEDNQAFMQNAGDGMHMRDEGTWEQKYPHLVVRWAKGGTQIWSLSDLLYRDLKNGGRKKPHIAVKSEGGGQANVRFATKLPGPLPLPFQRVPGFESTLHSFKNIGQPLKVQLPAGTAPPPEGQR